jgi:hypothetical protein
MEQLPAYRVPENYSLFKGYEWVPNFLKRKKLGDQIQALRKELSSLDKSLPDRETVLANFKNSHKGYLERRRLAIRKFVQSKRSSKDPLASFGGPFTEGPFDEPVFKTPVPWPEIEEAVKDLTGGVSDKEREKRRASIMKAIAELEADLESLIDLRFFEIDSRSGKPVRDLCEEFVEAWEAMQQKVNAPCSPYGFVLKGADKEEQDAWSALGLKALVSPKARYSPRSWPRNIS